MYCNPIPEYCISPYIDMRMESSGLTWGRVTMTMWEKRVDFTTTSMCLSIELAWATVTIWLSSTKFSCLLLMRYDFVFGLSPLRTVCSMLCYHTIVALKEYLLYYYLHSSEMSVSEDYFLLISLFIDVLITFKIVFLAVPAWIDIGVSRVWCSTGVPRGQCLLYKLFVVNCIVSEVDWYSKSFICTIYQLWNPFCSFIHLSLLTPKDQWRHESVETIRA